MVAGSRLSITSNSNAAFDPSGCWNAPMNQLVEYNLSPPRGPDSWVSTTKPLAMNIPSQPDPRLVRIIGMGHDSGLTDVPDARFIRYMLASFIAMFMPCI